MAAPASSVSFDSIARAYRWLEYATLGPLLQRTRMQFLPRLLDCSHALVLGDGDGRFLAELLRRNPRVQVEAVDTSAAMLALLRERTGDVRVTTHRMSALDFAPAGTVDLIATHFFLDCLTQVEVDALCVRLAESLQPGGLWVVSEFRIPTGGMRLPGRMYVGALYRVFGLLTGLQVRHLPDFASSLRAAGLVRVGLRHRFFGLLTSELWRSESASHAKRGDSALQ